MYAVARGLVGFPCSTLRVKVLEERDGQVWVVTADLLSAGVALTLNAEQVDTARPPILHGLSHIPTARLVAPVEDSYLDEYLRDVQRAEDGEGSTPDGDDMAFAFQVDAPAVFRRRRMSWKELPPFYAALLQERERVARKFGCGMDDSALPALRALNLALAMAFAAEGLDVEPETLRDIS